jgi:hypothetical protein
MSPSPNSLPTSLAMRATKNARIAYFRYLPVKDTSMNATDSSGNDTRTYGRPIPPATPREKAGDVIVMAKEWQILTSSLGWTLAVLGTIVTAFFALAADALFFLKHRGDPNFCPFLIGYCILYVFGVGVLLGIRQGGEWTGAGTWRHLLPSVLWTLGFLAVGEFAYFFHMFFVATQ